MNLLSAVQLCRSRSFVDITSHLLLPGDGDQDEDVAQEAGEVGGGVDEDGHQHLGHGGAGHLALLVHGVLRVIVQGVVLVIVL